MTMVEAQRKGYRVLAGPFAKDDAAEQALLARMRDYLRATGGRSQVVTDFGGTPYLYRPVAEMETIKQTERRLKMAKLRR